MFASSQTIFNCLTISAASLLVQSGDLTLDSDSAEKADALLAFGYEANGTVGFSAVAALDAFTTCASSGCKEKDGGTCDSALLERIDTVTADLEMHDYQGAIKNLTESLESYCNGADRALDSDISGPGVMVSYIIQTILALSLFLGINLLCSWIRPIIFPFLSCLPRYRLKGASKFGGTTTAWEAATSIQTSLAGSRPAAALLSTAVDFHEVQLFFVIGIQAAAALARLTSPGTFDSYVAVILNKTMLGSISLSGFVPCLLLEVLLRRHVYYRAGPGRPTPHSWWTLFLVTVTLILGFAAFSSQDGVEFGEDVASELNGSHPSLGCGGNAGLMVYCGLDTVPPAEVTGRLVYAYSVGYVAIPALWVEQIAWAIACRKKSGDFLRRAGWYGLGISGQLERKAAERNSTAFRVGRSVWIAILEFVWTIIQAGTVVFLLLYISALFNLIRYTGVSAPQWNFGQFVAVMVWAPTVTRWLYLTICRSYSRCFEDSRRLPWSNN